MHPCSGCAVRTCAPRRRVSGDIFVQTAREALVMPYRAQTMLFRLKTTWLLPDLEDLDFPLEKSNGSSFDKTIAGLLH